MSAPRHAPGEMYEKPMIYDVPELVAEIHRYLMAVDTFRAERCEPTWLPESVPCRTPDECAQAWVGRTRSAHGSG